MVAQKNLFMKKNYHYPLLLCAGLLVAAQFAAAQEAALTAAFKKSSIERLSELLNERYVFPDVAKNGRTPRQATEGGPL